MSAREDTPVLEPGTRIVRQSEGGRTRFIVRAGTTGKYLRVGEAEEALLSLLDGERSIARIRTAYMARRRENIAPADVAAFVNRMRALGVVKPTVEAGNLLLIEKARQRRQERHFSGRFGSLLFMRRKLFDPDRILDRLVGPLGFLFTRGFVIFSVILILAATTVLVRRWGEVAEGLSNMGLLIGAGSGLGLGAIWLTALTVVFLHEFGHGLTCKHYGGEVHEMGVLLLFFQPCFYANVNDAWTFESRSARLWVTAAGGFIEMVLGAACVLVWSISEPGTAVHGITQVVFTISISSTLLFNMNPLIKLDGYYLLADFLGIENLKDRSTTQLMWAVRHGIFGLPAPRATEDPRESRILITYAILSGAYMGLLLLVIGGVLLSIVTGDAGAGPGPFVLVVMATLFYILLKRPLAAMGGAVMDMARARNWSFRSPRFLGGCAAGVALAAGLAAVLPWTRISRGDAVLEPGRVVEVVSPLPGVLEELHVDDGAAVAAGDPLFAVGAETATLELQVARDLAARLERETARLEARGDAAGAELMRRKSEAAALRAADAARRLDGRRVTSPIDGTVLDRRLRDRRGGVVARDQVVVRVGDCSTLRAHVRMDGRSATPVRPGMEAVIRLRAAAGRDIEGKVVSVSGAPIPVTGDAATVAAAPAHARQWDVVVEIPNPDGLLRPGMTGTAKVVVGPTTVLGALSDAVRSTFSW